MSPSRQDDDLLPQLWTRAVTLAAETARQDPQDRGIARAVRELSNPGV